MSGLKKVSVVSKSLSGASTRAGGCPCVGLCFHATQSFYYWKEQWFVTSKSYSAARTVEVG